MRGVIADHLGSMLLACGFTTPRSRSETVKVDQGMALRELEAMQAAYELLSPLDPSAQQRVLTWLSAALADTDGPATAAAEPAAPADLVGHVPADNASPDNVAVAATEHAAAAPD